MVLHIENIYVQRVFSNLSLYFFRKLYVPKPVLPTRPWELYALIYISVSLVSQ